MKATDLPIRLIRAMFEDSGPSIACTRRDAVPARGHRWLSMLESDAATSLKAIARCEGVDDSCVSRMANLTTLMRDLLAASVERLLFSEGNRNLQSQSCALVNREHDLAVFVSSATTTQVLGSAILPVPARRDSG